MNLTHSDTAKCLGTDENSRGNSKAVLVSRLPTTSIDKGRIGGNAKYKVYEITARIAMAVEVSWRIQQIQPADRLLPPVNVPVKRIRVEGRFRVYGPCCCGNFLYGQRKAEVEKATFTYEEDFHNMYNNYLDPDIWQGEWSSASP